MKIIEKFPETITELHEIPVHWILKLETQTHAEIYPPKKISNWDKQNAKVIIWFL